MVDTKHTRTLRNPFLRYVPQSLKETKGITHVQREGREKKLYD